MNDSNEASEQPEILEATWDRQQVCRFFHDLQHGAEVRHVQVRNSSGDGPSEMAVTLEQARELFDAGHVQAIQIRYDFDEQGWCDTLMILPDAIRIIRTSTPSSE